MNAEEIDRMSVYAMRLLRRICLFIIPSVVCLFMLLPARAQAQSVLLRSQPAANTTLSSSPPNVQMWFSAQLNPTFTTASVIDSASGKRVDMRDAHVDAQDSTSLIVSLPANLSPSIYMVLWQTQSVQDGSILQGSFQFDLARSDGSVPQITSASVPGGTQSFFTGTTFFNLVVAAIIDLAVAFWVGAQLWQSFVIPSSDAVPMDQALKDEQRLLIRIHGRFERFFSWPVLLLLLISNVGFLVGQGLVLTGGQLFPALAPHILSGLVQASSFGTFWSLREVVILLALVLAVYLSRSRQRSSAVDGMLSLANLILALALLIVQILSSDAASPASDNAIVSELADWLQLLATSLWVGGLFYITLIFLPQLPVSLDEKRAFLLKTLKRFYPLMAVAVLLLLLTSPFSVLFHLLNLGQLTTTVYGRVLIVKWVLLIALLMMGVAQTFLIQPRQASPVKPDLSELKSLSRVGASSSEECETDAPAPRREVPDTKRRREFQQLQSCIRWSSLLGGCILVCSGLLTTFVGTLGLTVSRPSSHTQQPLAQPVTATFQTQDHLFTIDLHVSPGTPGTNTFTVSVLDSRKQPVMGGTVTAFVSMVEMDMGTDTVKLLPDGKGHFQAQEDLDMGGHWMIRVQIRSLDTRLHEGSTTIYTPL